MTDAKHEAPAEGAGDGMDAYTRHDTVDALRARSSAPEAREGEAVAWREVFIVDEEDGPVSGICIDMAGGSQIWTGECSTALLDSMGDERPDESGQFVMIAMKGRPTRVVASVPNADAGIEIARALASRITHPAAPSTDKLRIAVEALAPFAELAPCEETCGVNMNDPLSKWLTIADLVGADQALAALKAEGAK